LPTCQNDPATQLAVVPVEAGKTYRLRLINGGQLVMVGEIQKYPVRMNV
jgi:Multicopper oxidase